MASTSSSPPRVVKLEHNSSSPPIASKTPLPNPSVKLSFAHPPLSSSPILLALPTSTPSSYAIPTPVSSHLRPSSPSSAPRDASHGSSSPNCVSPGLYKRRQTKRARLPPPSPSAAVPAAVTATPAGKEPSALSKKMSEAGCKMSSFKVNFPRQQATAPGAPTKRKTERSGSPPEKAVRVIGFRHMSSTTPIASRTVAKQPKVEEHKLVSPSKRTFAFSSVAMGPTKSAPSAPAPFTPSVLMQPTRSVDSPLAKREEEGEPVLEETLPFSEADDAAIVRLTQMLKGDFVWVAKAMRPVRLPNEVGNRYAKLSRPPLARSQSLNAPALKLKRTHDTSDSPSSNKMSKSTSLGFPTSSEAKGISSAFLLRTPSLPVPKPTTFVIPNPKRDSASRSTSPTSAHPAAVKAATATAAGSSMSRSQSCSALPRSRHLPLPPKSTSPPVTTADRPILPPLKSSTEMSRAESLGMESNALRPLMMSRSSSVGGAGMVRLPSLREMLAGSKWNA